MPTGAFSFEPASGRRGGLGEMALLTRRQVLVHEPLSGGTVEQADGRGPLLGGGRRRLGLLERRAKRGALRAVAHGGSARLPHVLLRGCDIRHEKISRKFGKNRDRREPASYR